MDSVINKLTEIEQTASAIVAHAEAEKEKLDREYEEKRKVFDLRMEEETKARIEKIQEGLEHDKENLLTAGGAGLPGLPVGLLERGGYLRRPGPVD